jgi:C-terminal processing protease CtpA/Prc
VIPYISTSTDYILQDMAMSQLLLGVQGQRFDLTIRTPKGSLKSLSLVHERTDERDIHPPSEPQSLLDLRWYDGSIAYVALNSFGDPRIDSMFVARLPELYNAKALIIDLRRNGGGSTDIGREILGYLTKDSLLYGSKEITRSHLSAHKAWGAFVNAKDTLGDPWKKQSYLHFLDKVYYAFDYKPDKNTARGRRIVVPTALLVGHRTASAAEDFLIYADNQKHMARIGERSFGSTGQPFMFKLPGGGSARICTKKDTFPDGREFVGFGVAPHIEVKTTLEDWLKGNDPVLNKALEYVRTKL